MKTLAEIKKLYKSETIDGRDISRLAKFIPEEEFPNWGLKISEEFKGKHVPVEFTKENVLAQLRDDVDFGFEKALNKRGISASCMFSVVKMWNWVLENELADFDDDGGYAQYGLPLFKATALLYGFPNPIGEDAGNEDKYSCYYDGD